MFNELNRIKKNKNKNILKFKQKHLMIYPQSCMTLRETYSPTVGFCVRFDLKVNAVNMKHHYLC